MGFFSFLGRVLFASLFILSAWQMFNEFGDDGGPAVTELIPKLAIFKKHLSSLLGVGILDIDPRHLVAGMIALKGLGGFLFVFGSPLVLISCLSTWCFPPQFCTTSITMIGTSPRKSFS
ncbi:hypothetical protein NC652_021764 [Populus alba x Populus x berolinensis]|nr:hypothetical protein NC652_021764 [Populus alba x Populus x berolinensis]